MDPSARATRPGARARVGNPPNPVASPRRSSGGPAPACGCPPRHGRGRGRNGRSRWRGPARPPVRTPRRPGPSARSGTGHGRGPRGSMSSPAPAGWPARGPWRPGGGRPGRAGHGPGAAWRKRRVGPSSTSKAPLRAPNQWARRDIQPGVATLEPFRALLYAPSIDPALVTSPPYDVISAAERQRLEGLHPYNIISIILGAELPGYEPGSDKYTRSAAHLRDWIAAGVLVPEDRPHLYAYRMDYEIDGVPGSSGGVIGALDLEPVASGGIHPHEHTMPKPRSDRLELMRTTQANLEPIWLVGGPGVVGPAVGAASQLAPLIDFVDPARARHRLWP